MSPYLISLLHVQQFEIALRGVGGGGAGMQVEQLQPVGARPGHVALEAAQDAALEQRLRVLRCDGKRPLDILQREVRRSEEHTSELQSLMRTSYAVFCLKKKNQQ